MGRNKTVTKRALTWSRLAQSKAVDCCGRPAQPRGNGATPGGRLPEAEQKEYQGGHNAGKTTGNTTATKGCLLQASRLQQVTATG